MTAPVVVTTEAATAHARRCAALGIALGVVLTVAVAHWTQAPADEYVPDPRMETACAYPRGEGEMTVLVVLEGKLVCWRWR